MGFCICLHGDDTPTAQAGATSHHGPICSNIRAALHRPARTGDCRLYQSDMKVLISQFSDVRYYYPDLVLTCGPVQGYRKVERSLGPFQEPEEADTNNLDFIVSRSSPEYATNRISTASSTLRWPCAYTLHPAAPRCPVVLPIAVASWV